MARNRQEVGPFRKATKSTARTSLRRHATVAVVSLVLVFGGLGGWAATTQIAGAVVAPGLLVVEGGSKRVQHSEGGIVAEILVENEDHVEAGQLLVLLDGTAIEASLEVIVSQLREAFSRQARLITESESGETMVTAPLAINWPADAELERLYAAQDMLRRSRQSAMQAQQLRLAEQIRQTNQQIVGLESQRDAVNEQLRLFEAEEVDLTALYEANLVEVTRLNAMRRELAAGRGEVGRIDAEIAKARATIAELGAASAQIVDEFQSSVLTELQEVGQQIAQLLQEKIAADDRVRRLEILAPLSGTVHESVVQTVGGVIGSGQTLMMIVPEDSSVILDSRVSPLDIDKLFVSQHAMVNMVGLSSRTNQELAGVVVSISPDLTTDPVTNLRYYQVRVSVDDSELTKLTAGVRLVPGMPADVYVQTAERTVLSYLIGPLADQFRRTFRED